MATALHQLLLCVSVCLTVYFLCRLFRLYSFSLPFVKLQNGADISLFFPTGRFICLIAAHPANTFSELTLRLFGVVPPQNGSLPPCFPVWHKAAFFQYALGCAVVRVGFRLHKIHILLRKCPPGHALNRLGHIAVSFVGRQNAVAYLNSAVFSRPAAIQQHLVQAQRYIAREVDSLGNTAQFPPCGLSTAPAAAARHLRCQNAR